MDPASPDVSEHEPGTVSGRWVVVGMFLFGITATAALWLYWHYNTAPFRPLQEAIHAAYPDSQPRVEGGRLKGRADAPSILRIVMRVEYDPTEEKERAAALAREVAGMARERLDLTQYDQLEFHIFRRLPEERIVDETIVIPTSEVPGAGGSE